MPMWLGTKSTMCCRPAVADRVGERGMRLGAAQLAVHLVVVGDVVAVRDARLRGEVRGGVDRADPQPLKVGHDVARRGQRESGVDLEPVGADRHEARTFHLSQPLRQAVQRNARPVRPVVQLVVQLVERLVDQEQVEQRRALRRVGGQESPRRRRPRSSLEERRAGPALPDARPRLQRDRTRRRGRRCARRAPRRPRS